VLTAINRPAHQEWATPLAAIEFALNLEKQVNQVLKNYYIEIVSTFRHTITAYFM
jgi:hypothetical protein